MKPARRLTAIIRREDEGFVNLTEALTLFFETADPSEIVRRFPSFDVVWST